MRVTEETRSGGDNSEPAGTLADQASIIGIGNSGGSDIATEGKDAVATAITDHTSAR